MLQYVGVMRLALNRERMEYVRSLDTLEQIFPASVLTDLILEYADLDPTEPLFSHVTTYGRGGRMYHCNF
jgi:hypothetical protein